MVRKVNQAMDQKLLSLASVTLTWNVPGTPHRRGKRKTSKNSRKGGKKGFWFAHNRFGEQRLKRWIDYLEKETYGIEISAFNR